VSLKKLKEGIPFGQEVDVDGGEDLFEERNFPRKLAVSCS